MCAQQQLSFFCHIFLILFKLKQKDFFSTSINFIFKTFEWQYLQQPCNNNLDIKFHPLFKSNDKKANCNAAVPLETEDAYLTFKKIF